MFCSFFFGRPSIFFIFFLSHSYRLFLIIFSYGFVSFLFSPLQHVDYFAKKYNSLCVSYFNISLMRHILISLMKHIVMSLMRHIAMSVITKRVMLALNSPRHGKRHRQWSADSAILCEMEYGRLSCEKRLMAICDMYYKAVNDWLEAFTAFSVCKFQVLDDHYKFFSFSFSF